MYPVAADALPTAWGVMYKYFKSLILHIFLFFWTKISIIKIWKRSRFFPLYFQNFLIFLLLLCILSYLFCCSTVQDTMLTPSAVISGQHFTCIWEFLVAPLEFQINLFTYKGSNDVGWDQMQAKIHLHMHISALKEAFKYKKNMNKGVLRCIYMFATCICILMYV